MLVAASPYREHVTPDPDLFCLYLLNMDRALQKAIEFSTRCQDQYMRRLDDTCLGQHIIGRLPKVVPNGFDHVRLSVAIHQPDGRRGCCSLSIVRYADQ